MSFFAYYFLKEHLHHHSQNSRNQCSSYYFCLMIRIFDYWIRIREAQSHMDPTDTQHCFLSSL
jgi:hypothetical protein